MLRSREDLAGARILQADALEFDYAGWANGAAWFVAANLPYNIATPLLLRLIEMEGGPASLTVMVQKDVAQRFAARPGTAAYGSLSVAIQYAMIVEPELTLAPGSFYPAPKVESRVVRMMRRERPPVRVARSGPFLEGRARRVRVPAQDARQQSRPRARNRTRDDRTSAGAQQPLPGASR